MMLVFRRYGYLYTHMHIYIYMMCKCVYVYVSWHTHTLKQTDRQVLTLIETCIYIHRHTNTLRSAYAYYVSMYIRTSIKIPLTFVCTFMKPVMMSQYIY